MKIISIIMLGMVFTWCNAPSVDADETRSLAGDWRFELDRRNAGVSEQWFKRELADTIALPGSVQTRMKGDPLPPSGPEFWESLKKRGRYHMTSHLRSDYKGNAWYQLPIEIPAEWEGKFVELFLERVCWVSEAWLDERPLGTQDSLSAPHRYALGVLEPGTHRLTVRVDNRALHYLGNNTHAYHYNMSTIYNGMIGKLELRATAPVAATANQVFADPASGDCELRLTLANRTDKLQQVTIEAGIIGEGGTAPLGTGSRSISLPPGVTNVAMRVAIPQDKVRVWGEFERPLYTARVEVSSPAGKTVRADRFGFRSFIAEGTSFLINGHPVLLRGEANCAAFPLTGHPSMDKEEWLRILNVCRDFGLNHLRFHSWTPPAAAFEAADELGIYMQPELPNSVNATDSKPEQVRPWMQEEFDRILETYGNHPSFVMMSMGNEAKVASLDFLESLTARGQQADPRRLYCTIANPMAFSSKLTEVPGDDFAISHSGYVDGKHALRRMERPYTISSPETAGDYRESLQGAAMPGISHEVGQWYVYPDLSEIERHTGAIQPVLLDMFRASAKETGMLAMNEAFHTATGLLSLELYKEEIERSLRTPNYGGFQLLGLQDYFGQGAAYVGMVDSFFEPKPFVTAQQFRSFCAPMVALARMPKRTWMNSETFQATIDFAQYGPKTVENGVIEWRVLDAAGARVAEGQFPARDLPNTGLLEIGEVTLPLAQFDSAAPLRIEAGLRGGPVNGWDFWVYPDQPLPQPAEVLVVETLDQTARDALAAGKRVALFPSGFASIYATSLAPPFWSPIYFPNYSRCLGLLCDPAHPALKQFPTESQSDWQWYDLLQQGSAIHLHGTPADYRPIVQAIDRPDRNHKLALVYEMKVGPGKLLVCTLDLNRNLDQRPAARQLRRSLLAYAAGDEFDPAVEIPLQGNLPGFVAESRLARLSPKVTANNQHFEGNWAHFAVDNNRATFWSTTTDEPLAPMPHSLTVEVEQPVRVKGFTQTPRPDSDLGRITQYRISTSRDGVEWEVAAEGTWANSAGEQKVMLNQPVEARFFKLEALKELRDRSITCVAEFDVIPE